MRYFEKISGERLFLSPMHPDDAEFFTRWSNDPAVAVWFGRYRDVYTLPGERKYIEEAAADGRHHYSIVLREGDEHRLIGYIQLAGINHIDAKADLNVFIGEEADRGKGYGAEAIRLLLGYGFNTMHLHNIQLHAFSGNAQAIACYKKVGFKELGRRREAKFINGRYVDSIYMDILDREFFAQ